METMSRLGQVIGRVAIGAIFVISALGKLTNWQGTLSYAGTKGVSATLLAIATALELLGGLSIIVGFKARWGALALLIFLVPVTLVFHNFWAVDPAQQQAQLVNFLKNLSILGGILIVLSRGAGAYSIDEARGRTSTPAATASAR